MEANDPEAPTTTTKRVPLRRLGHHADQGVARWSTRHHGHERRDGRWRRGAQQRLASNFLVVGANRSATGEPMAVMGPQLGYYDPEIVDRGRPPRPRHQRAGRAHPRRQPVRAHRAHEELRLEPHHRDQRQHGRVPREALRAGWRPQRRPLRLQGQVHPDAHVRRRHAQNASTDNQPRRCATTSPSTARCRAPCSSAASPTRSPRTAPPTDEDAFGIAALRDMTVGKGSTVRGFYKAANQFGFTFNWAYAGRRHVAYFSSGQAAGPRGRHEQAAAHAGHGRIRLEGLPAAGEAPARRPTRRAA